jgi:RNA polymerase sigma-70 factor, ECF subfamily
VVRYRAIDIARSNHRHASRRAGDDQLPVRSAVDDPLEIVVARDDALRLQASLAMLPRAQAEAITLAYSGQPTHTEIAARLGLPSGTVKGPDARRVAETQSRHRTSPSVTSQRDLVEARRR